MFFLLFFREISRIKSRWCDLRKVMDAHWIKIVCVCAASRANWFVVKHKSPIKLSLLRSRSDKANQTAAGRSTTRAWFRNSSMRFPIFAQQLIAAEDRKRKNNNEIQHRIWEVKLSQSTTEAAYRCIMQLPWVDAFVCEWVRCKSNLTNAGGCLRFSVFVL